MRRYFWLSLMLFSVGLQAAPVTGTLFQYSTLDALSQGVFDGDLTVAQAKAHGNFGLGTFNGLDGELVMLGGVIYQARSNGKVTVASDDQKVPFVAVASATSPEPWEDLAGSPDFSSLQARLDGLAPEKNQFYAFRIEGRFAELAYRSVPAQAKPYKTLSEAAKGQVLFSGKNVEGTLVGFRCPAWAKGINLPAYHFHYLSKSHLHGGHVLSCRLEKGKARVSVVRIENVDLVVPGTEAFNEASLPLGSAESLSLDKAESGPKK